MEKRQLGRSGIEVSELCLGCMMFGTQLSKEESFHQLDRAYEGGITFYDTAEMYSVPPSPEVQGLSERVLGEWINSRGLRDKVVLASKVVGRSTLLPYIRESGELPRPVIPGKHGPGQTPFSGIGSARPPEGT